jgi:hypothetical protein
MSVYDISTQAERAHGKYWIYGNAKFQHIFSVGRLPHIARQPRYSWIRMNWNSNISDSHFNVEPATQYVLSAEKTHRQNDTVTLFHHSRTSRSTETREPSTSPSRLDHAETVTPKLQERTVTEKQVKPIIEPQ